MKTQRTRWVLSAWLALIPAMASADVKLPKLISDHMVLQRSKPATIWGWADVGEKVVVKFRGKSYAATANKLGEWRVRLAASKAGGPFNLSVRGKNQIKIKDVLVGEVWICSGQSNMAWPVSRTIHSKQEIAAANHPQLRLFTAQRRAIDTPQKQLGGRGQRTWQTCTPQSARGFSAVAYFFGRKLQKDLSVPIGLVNTSWGGTRAEAWTRRQALQKRDILRPIVKHWDTQVENWDEVAEKEKYQVRLAAWKKRVAAAKKNKKRRRRLRRPRPPIHPKNARHRNSNLYNGMIAPLLPYAIRGAIWYQGEANVGRAEQYATLFPTMIQNWREDWKQGDFPFLFVQLAPFRYRRHPQAACAELWEAQARTLSLPNTGMAVTTDIGNVRDIHPKNKQEVGRRLAIWALAKTYKKNLVHSGPLYQSMKVEGNRIRLSFASIGNGLSSRDGKDLSFFTICGEDKKFHPAVARIAGDSVVVSCDKVAKPIAVRFAWTDIAVPNLMNREGLPASPFRTDKFRLLTAGKFKP